MRKLKLLLLLGFFLNLSSIVSGQTNNPKKKYFGESLKSRFTPIGQEELKNIEFSEVLNLAELLEKKVNKKFTCKIFFCNNGPSDPELEYCNESTNYYISNGTYELPNEFRLFKIGPFYDLEKTTLTIGNKPDSYLLSVQHKYDNEKWLTQYLIEFEKITLLKNNIIKVKSQ